MGRVWYLSIYYLGFVSHNFILNSTDLYSSLILKSTVKLQALKYGFFKKLYL